MTGSSDRRRIRKLTDDGMALVSVMGALFVLTAFLLSTLAFAMQNMRPGRADQDAQRALAAAQAGIDDYVGRLNDNGNYWSLGNIDTTSCPTPPTVAQPSPCNVAFTTGRPLPGAGNAGATYKYTVLSSSSDTALTGFVRLRSVGSSGNSTVTSRTLTAKLRPSGFLQYIYHTDKEDLDPDLDPSLTAAEKAACARHWYDENGVAGRNASSGACTEIAFASGDNIRGPLHTNDAMSIGAGGVTFADPRVETSWADPARLFYRSSNGGRPLTANAPFYSRPVTIPSSNDSLLQQADPAVAGGVGCVYTGATKIVFTGTTMSVTSPNTAAGVSVPSRCFNGAAPNKLIAQAGLAIPPIIYVKGLTGSCSSGSKGLPETGTFLTNEYTDSSNYHGPAYNCALGNAFVSGVVNGQVTVASAQDLVVDGDLTQSDGSSGSDDLIGLIPAHFVWVYHPVRAVSKNFQNMLDTPVTQIAAAILAVKDSFIVQNWDLGPRLSSPLTVDGAISQNFRGPVGTSAPSGYVKNYVYDDRFARGVQPPYFLQPSSALWAAIKVSDG